MKKLLQKVRLKRDWYREKRKHQVRSEYAELNSAMQSCQDCVGPELGDLCEMLNAKLAPHRKLRFPGGWQ
jgi:hypothetical protein